jgi:hypothetical protein
MQRQRIMRTRRVITAALVAAGAFALLACSNPVPEEKLDYVGLWRSRTMSLLIVSDGSVEYERIKKGATVTVSGPLQEFRGDDFSVGIGPLNTTFEVETPPYLDGSQWKMVVDGVELTRVGDTLDLAYIDYGIVTEIPDPQAPDSEHVYTGFDDGNAVVVEPASRIPAQRGVGFGAVYELMVPAELEGAPIEVRWDFPPMRDPESGALTASYGFQTEAFDEETVNVTYVFEEAWELVPGEWVLQILHQNQVVARKAFQVYRP